MNKIVGEYKVNVYITDNDVENVIVSCFEGGSNYWLGVDNTGEDWERRPKGEPLSMWASKLLLEGKTLNFYDVEDRDEKWTLNLEQLIKGFQLNQNRRPSDCNLQNADATTYDCILQYALFDEIVFA